MRPDVIRCWLLGPVTIFLCSRPGHQAEDRKSGPSRERSSVTQEIAHHRREVLRYSQSLQMPTDSIVIENSSLLPFRALQQQCSDGTYQVVNSAQCET